VDQRLGGGLAWASGEIPLMIVVVALVVQWSRIDERSARRADRRAELDGDADLTAYNAMLRQMAAQEGPTASSSTGSTRAPDVPEKGAIATPRITSGTLPPEE
jgi:putative copper resistance protein D